MNLIFLGAPGAGKGTQAARVSAALAVPAISTGDIIRSAIKAGDPLGLEFKSYIDKGCLVPDDLVCALVKERLSQPDCKKGYILDGFPRTIKQAKFLDENGMAVDRVVDIFVSDETIVSRMGGRRFCPKCQKTYHVRYSKPEKEGICDTCQVELVIRDDDKPETVINRLSVYHKETEPLIEYYEGKLLKVDGTKTPEEITEKILASLGK